MDREDRTLILEALNLVVIATEQNTEKLQEILNELVALKSQLRRS